MLEAWDRPHQLFSVTPEGNAVEKAHGIGGDVDTGSRQLPFLDQMVKPVGDFLVREQLWGAPIVACQFRDVVQIGLLSALRSTTNSQVPDKFGSKWCHRLAIMPTLTS